MRRKITLQELEELYLDLVNNRMVNLNSSDPFLAGPKKSPQIVQDTDMLIKYRGIWSKREHKTFSKGTCHSSSVKNSSLTLLFQGTAIEFWGAKGPARGRAEVILDGVKIDEIDLYSKQFQPKQLLGNYKVPWGNHFIRIKVLREKNPRSLGFRVDLDHFKIF